MAKGHRPAGGIASRNVKNVGYRPGPGARAVNKAWPAQVGISRGNRVQGGAEDGGGHTLPLSGIRAEPYKGPSFNPVPQGNAVAAATVCGVGGSRTVYRSGSQGGMRSPNAPAKNRGLG